MPAPSLARTTAVAVVALLAVLATAALVAFLSAGGRLFVVETPSMGIAAPVGALVATVPPTGPSFATARAGDAVRIGDVVTFLPPDSVRPWTHRVVEVDDRGLLHTRGDVNDADDPWLLPVDALIGRVVVTLPVAGLLVQALPSLALGVAAAWALSGSTVDRATRGAVRTLGCTIVIASMVAITRPLVDVQTLSTARVDGVVLASFVSAGLLPTRLTADDGTSIRLQAGETGRLSLPDVPGGRLSLESALALTPGQWALALALCATPLLICAVIERSRPHPFARPIIHRPRGHRP